jgi:cytoskeletal protein CcmA (bactofilin family)
MYLSPVVREELSGTVDRMGTVVLEQQSVVNADVTCSRMTIGGRYRGRACVHGAVELGGSSTASGDIAAHGIVIPLGASFTGHLRIGPPRQRT